MTSEAQAFQACTLEVNDISHDDDKGVQVFIQDVYHTGNPSRKVYLQCMWNSLFF